MIAAVKKNPEQVISALLKYAASRKQIVKEVSKLVNKGKKVFFCIFQGRRC